jgi:hypothetical protein
MMATWKSPLGLFVLAVVILSLYLWSGTNNAEQTAYTDKAEELVVTYGPDGSIVEVKDGNGKPVKPVSINTTDYIGYINERSKVKPEIVYGSPSLHFVFRRSEPKCNCKGYGLRIFCTPQVPGCPP